MIQIASQLESNFGLSSVKPVGVPAIHKTRLPTYHSWFLGWLGERKVFIKRRFIERAQGRKVGKIHETEYKCLQRLYEINRKNFPEVLFYSEDEHYCCVGMEFLDGDILERKINSTDFSPSERENIIAQLKEITKNLLEAGIVHRDIAPHNFLVMNDGTLKLIDFERAVYCDGYEDCPPLSLLLSSRNMCAECARGDITRMLKTLKKIGCHESYQETYRDVEVFLKGCQCKPVVKCKHRRRFFLYLPLFWLERTLTILRKIGNILF